MLLEKRVTKETLDPLVVLGLLDQLETRDLLASQEYLVYQEELVPRDTLVHLDHVDSQELLDLM